jgi:hypothetical protein
MTEAEAKGIVGLSKQLVTALPAQFLLLLLINILLVGGFVWHMDSQLDARERVLIKLVETCGK